MNRFEIIMNFREKFSAFLILFFIIVPCSSANNAHHHHSPSLSTPYFGQYAGPFQDYGHHGIEGELYLVDDRSLFLYNFSYDGLDSGKFERTFLHGQGFRSCKCGFGPNFQIFGFPLNISCKINFLNGQAVAMIIEAKVRVFALFVYGSTLWIFGFS